MKKDTAELNLADIKFTIYWKSRKSADGKNAKCGQLLRSSAKEKNWKRAKRVGKKAIIWPMRSEITKKYAWQSENIGKSKQQITFEMLRWKKTKCGQKKEIAAHNGRLKNFGNDNLAENEVSK